jgi:hypothetical protein
MSDDWTRGAPSRASSVTGLWLVAATLLAGVGLAIALLQNAQLSTIAYAVVLVVGTTCLAMHRWTEATRSLQPDYVIPSRFKRRASVVPAILLLACCAGNAFVWATEVAKV